MANKQTKKSRSQQREEQRQARVRFWMGMFIIALMVLSVFSFAFVFYGGNLGNQGTGDFNYRITTDNRLLVQTSNGEIPFYSFPDNEAPIPPQATHALTNATSLIIAFDPQEEQNLPYIDLVRWEFTQYIPLQQGTIILSESETYTHPVADCSVATPQAPVIQFIDGNEGVSINASCITVSASGEVILLQRDQLLYAYYGLR